MISPLHKLYVYHKCYPAAHYTGWGVILVSSIVSLGIGNSVTTVATIDIDMEKWVGDPHCGLVLCVVWGRGCWS